LSELPPTIFKFKDEKNSELVKMANHLFNLPPSKGAKDAKDKKKEG
jgi:hypothetical protein